MQIKDSIASLSGTRLKNISAAKNKVDKHLNFYDFGRAGLAGTFAFKRNLRIRRLR